MAASETGRAACNSGETRIAGACANAWPRPADGSAQPFYPWQPEGWTSSASQSVVQRLSPSNCPSVWIHGRNTHRGFVEISCGRSGNRLLVNEDALACSATNIAENPNLIFSNDRNACTAFGVYDAADPANLSALRTFVAGLAEGTPRRILERAIARYTRNRQLVNHDMEVLADVWDRDYEEAGQAGEMVAAARVGERFERALDSLGNRVASARRVFGENCTGRISKNDENSIGDHTRVTQARRTCRLLVRAYETYRARYNQVRERAELTIEESNITLSPEEREYFIRVRLGRDLISLLQANVASEERVANNDDMAFRMFLYSGLTENEQNQVSPRGIIREEDLPVSGKLALFRWNTEFNSFGQRAPFGEITNGYVFGGHREINRRVGGVFSRRQAGSYSGTNDCSTFVAGLFHPGARGITAPTTLDFEAIGKALSGQALSNAERERFRDNYRYASCLEAVDYRRTAPQPSDILVNRTAGEGHVIVVHSYDPRTGNIRALEAAGSSSSNNTIDFTLERSIYEPSCMSANPPADGDWNVRPVRAGLTALRFKANPPRECPLSQS